MLRSDGLVGACIARREVALRILGDEVGLSRKYDAAVEGDRRLVRLSEGDSLFTGDVRLSSRMV